MTRSNFGPNDISTGEKDEKRWRKCAARTAALAFVAHPFILGASLAIAAVLYYAGNVGLLLALPVGMFGGGVIWASAVYGVVRFHKQVFYYANESAAAVMIIEEAKEPHVVKIGMFGATPKRRGAGTTLGNYALTWASANGKTIALTTRPKTRERYEQAGFVAVGPVKWFTSMRRCPRPSSVDSEEAN